MDFNPLPSRTVVVFLIFSSLGPGRHTHVAGSTLWILLTEWMNTGAWFFFGLFLPKLVVKVWCT